MKGSRTWYSLIETEPRTGAENMAVDQHLLDLVERGLLDRPVLRIYSWNRPTLSLGFLQEWRRNLSLEALERHGVGLVRRWTGGRAVLHDDEMTYSVVAPFLPPFASRVTHNYELIGDAMRRFTELGRFRGFLAQAEENAAASRKWRDTPCFASLSKSEVETGGKKLIGSAQKLGKAGFLQHGSIPFWHREEVLREVTGTKLEMGELMTSLGEHYQAAGLALPSLAELQQRLLHSFGASFGVYFEDLQEANLIDQNEVKRWSNERFANEAWTFRK